MAGDQVYEVGCRCGNTFYALYLPVVPPWDVCETCLSPPPKPVRVPRPPQFAQPPLRFHSDFYRERFRNDLDRDFAEHLSRK